jgi:predicted nuclease of predicted toxin-antitoxin system
MSRLLLDENMPKGMRNLRADHTVESAYRMGWGALANGDLITAAEAAGFDAMVTADSNIQYQQNLTGRRLALIVLSTNNWPIIRACVDAVRAAVQNAKPGSYTTVELDRPALRRRPPPTAV